MSINFDRDMNPEALAHLKELVGEPVAHDNRTVLIDKINTLRQAEMKALANKAGAVTTVELNDEGDIKSVGGVDYQCTPKGWVKIGLTDPKKLARESNNV